MGKKNNIKEVLRYCDLLSEELYTRFGDDPTLKDLIQHLAQYGMIKPIVVRNYLIIHDFYIVLKKNDGHMNHTFMDISIEYDLSERQIQTIIYEYQKKFESKNNICR